METKAGHFDPSEFEDRYETAVVEMLKQKQAGMPPRKEAPTAPPATVVNLMDALVRSVQAERPAAKNEGNSSQCSGEASAISGPRKMLRRAPLPIAHRVERQLTAILAADVAGYSRLTGIDEEGVHTRSPTTCIAALARLQLNDRYAG